MKTKHNVFVPVGSQQEAERMEKVLRAMGVKIGKGIYFETYREDYPCVLGFDSVDGEALLCHLKHRIALRAQITFGKLIDILSKPEKIAVKVDNEIQRDGISKFAKPIFNYAFDKYPAFITIDNTGFYYSETKAKKDDYTIIPFQDFAKEHNIKVPDYIDLFQEHECPIRVYKDFIEVNGDWHQMECGDIVKITNDELGAISKAMEDLKC